MVITRLSGLRVVNSVRSAPQVAQKLRVLLADEAYSRAVPASQRKFASGTLIQVVTRPPLLRQQMLQ